MKTTSHIDNEQHFYIHQFFTEPLEEMSYYIESEAQAIIIDPLRDISFYTQLASERNAQIKYVLLTQFHSNFVAGHINLNKKTEAKILIGPTQEAQFDSHILSHEELIELGEVNIKVLNTPGHKIESCCFLLEYETVGYCLFTGNTLLLGDVGRPIFSIHDAIQYEEEAGMLYESLRNNIIPLDANLLIYPGHGEGSFFGKNVEAGRFDTLENEKETNYALENMDKEEFVNMLSSNTLDWPEYFSNCLKMNKQKDMPENEEILEKGLCELNWEDIETNINGIELIDIRSIKEFEEGFLKNSLNITFESSFTKWVYELVSPSQKIVLIASTNQENAINELLSIGYDNIIGCLKFDKDKFDKIESGYLKTIECVIGEDFIELKSPYILDVREPHEYNKGHLKESVSLPLSQLIKEIQTSHIELPKNENIYVHCQGGTRATVACSLLKLYGFENVRNIEGGYRKLVSLGCLEM